MNVPLNINLQQILLHLFNFAILAFGLYFLLYKPVKDFMAKREAHYAAMNEEAESHLAKAKATEEEYRSRLNSAEEEINGMRREAQAELDRLAHIRSGEAEAEARRIISAAEAAAQQEKEKIIESARDEVSRLAVGAVKKIMNDSLSDSFDDFLSSAERSDS